MGRTVQLSHSPQRERERKTRPDTRAEPSSFPAGSSGTLRVHLPGPCCWKPSPALLAWPITQKNIHCTLTCTKESVCREQMVTVACQLELALSFMEKSKCWPGANKESGTQAPFTVLYPVRAPLPNLPHGARQLHQLQPSRLHPCEEEGGRERRRGIRSPLLHSLHWLELRQEGPLAQRRLGGRPCSRQPRVPMISI